MNFNTFNFDTEKMEKQQLQKFEEFLAQQNLRLTTQRQIIAAVLLKHKGHISSEDLYRKVQKTSPHIGHTTVYRTLKLLAEAGLAIRKDFGDGFARFESAVRQDHHDHLICTSCGKIIEFVNDQIESLQSAVAKQHHFQVTAHSLDMYGICSECRGKGK